MVTSVGTQLAPAIENSDDGENFQPTGVRTTALTIHRLVLFLHASDTRKSFIDGLVPHEILTSITLHGIKTKPAQGTFMTTPSLSAKPFSARIQYLGVRVFTFRALHSRSRSMSISISFNLLSRISLNRVSTSKPSCETKGDRPATFSPYIEAAVTNNSRSARVTAT